MYTTITTRKQNGDQMNTNRKEFSYLLKRWRQM